MHSYLPTISFIFLLSRLLIFPPFSEPPPPPVVYSRIADDAIRNLIGRLKERTKVLKEKAIDPYSTSPEITPPVSKYGPSVSQDQNWSQRPSNSASLSPPGQHPSWGSRTTSGWRNRSGLPRKRLRKRRQRRQPERRRRRRRRMRRKGWRLRRRQRRRSWQRKQGKRPRSSRTSTAPVSTSSSDPLRTQWMTSWGTP